MYMYICIYACEYTCSRGMSCRLGNINTHVSFRAYVHSDISTVNCVQCLLQGGLDMQGLYTRMFTYSMCTYVYLLDVYVCLLTRCARMSTYSMCTYVYLLDVHAQACIHVCISALTVLY